MMIWMLMVDLVSSGLTCPKFKCAKSGQLTSGVCITQDSGTYYVSPCKDYVNTYCPVSLTSNSSCTTPQDLSYFAYPGERCEEATDCLYGTCIRGYCFGQEILSDCSVSGECNPGLFCASYLGRCFPLLQETDTGCQSEYECDYGMTCDNGRCVPYHSVHDNSWIFNCSDGFSDACRSGQCLYGMCVKGARTKGGYPRKCSSLTDCYSDDYKSQGIKFYTNCSCGYNSKGQGYCELFPGDKPYEEYIKIRKEWISLNISHNCNTVRRFSKECMFSHYKKSFGYLFEYKMYKALNYPVLYDADDCVLKVMQNDYYIDDKKLDDFAYLLSFMIISLIT